MNFLLESSLLRVLEKLFDENSHERESVLLILIKKERKDSCFFIGRSILDGLISILSKLIFL